MSTWDVVRTENAVRDVSTGAVHDVSVRRKLVDARCLEATVPVVADEPVAVQVELSAEGESGLGDDLGRRCDVDAVNAVAIEGEPEALEVVTAPADECATTRFTLTPELGAFEALEWVGTEDTPDPPTAVGGTGRQRGRLA